MLKKPRSLSITNDQHDAITRVAKKRDRDFSNFVCHKMTHYTDGTMELIMDDFANLCNKLCPVMVFAQQEGGELEQRSNDESMILINRIRANLGRVR